MKTFLLGSLEKIIENWISEHCSDDGWPDVYIYDDLTQDMAKAAAIVFDANAKGQEYLENEEKE